MLRICDFYRKFQCLNKIQAIKVVLKRKFRIKLFTMNRKWNSYTQQSGSAKNIRTEKSFKLLSYNILAQDLLIEHLNLYYKISNVLLQWENRLNKICKEISDIQPDILCLQEMQYDHVKQLIHQLSSVHPRKWEYVFKKKTGTRSDGCIIIFDKNKFRMIADRYVEYYTDGVAKLNRENIGVMVKLQEKGNNKSMFVVATTHLLYNPKREDVRVCQVNKLIAEIIDFSNITHLGSEHLPVILTGDFNFTPGGPAFQALTSPRNYTSNSEQNENGRYSDEHGFQLEAINFGNSNAASTYHQTWITVDYILKSRTRDKNAIQVNSIYKLPSLEECWKIGMLPNNFVGSDHFLLAVNFAIS